MTYDAGGQTPASSLLLTKDGPRACAPRERLVEVAVPVYNEEKILARSVRQLHSYLTRNLPFRFVITIAENASTDGTFAAAQQLCAELSGVRAVHLDRKGRGLALRRRPGRAWAGAAVPASAYSGGSAATSGGTGTAAGPAQALYRCG